MTISSWIKRLNKETSKTKPLSKRTKGRIEKALLSRLRVLGFVLYGFSALFLFYALTYSPSEVIPKASLPIEDVFCEEFLPHETLNFFTVSAIFFILGSSCIFTSWRQLKVPNKK